ncbi:signal peptidase I [Actinomadura roseirufa]|uniref:signal peptidase I n=1 Tax=Actinomadura roseirufa TaxID=2094049 RepID=UPI001A95602C|nr:signal peptidase I [Actinomadura roseirufa]
MIALRAAAVAAGAAAVAATGAVLVARRRFTLTTVDGPSMEPTLRSGDRLLVRKTTRVRRGQIVLFKNPKDEGVLLLKRTVAVQGDRLPTEWSFPDIEQISGRTVPPSSYVVLGDNRPTSFDSRHFGFISRESLVGVMLRRVS